MNALEKFAYWFNHERVKALTGKPPDIMFVEESKTETILNHHGERDGLKYRVTTAKLYEVIG